MRLALTAQRTASDVSPAASRPDASDICACERGRGGAREKGEREGKRERGAKRGRKKREGEAEGGWGEGEGGREGEKRARVSGTGPPHPRVHRAARIPPRTATTRARAGIQGDGRVRACVRACWCARSCVHFEGRGSRLGAGWGMGGREGWAAL